MTGSANDSPNARHTMTRPGIDRLPRVWTCRWLFSRRAASLTCVTQLHFSHPPEKAKICKEIGAVREAARLGKS